MEESDKKDTGAPDIYFLTESVIRSEEETKKSYASLDWYVIKNEDSTSKTNVLSPHLSPLPHDCNLSTHIVIRSTIYIVGGYVCGAIGQYNKTRAVYYIDIRHPENGWKGAPPMKNERVRPSAFGVGDKLYVFGGCNYNRQSYVEVFDPVCNKWENFPRIKDGRDLPHCVRVQVVIGGEDDDTEKKVLLRETGTSKLYLFDTICGSFQAINMNLPSRDVKSSALVDGVLYGVGRRKETKIFAYDLEHLDSGSKSVINIFDYTGFDYDEDGRQSRYCNARLVSKGNGILAVLSRVNEDDEDSSACKIGCFNFQMVKCRRSSGEPYVKANLLSSSTHFVNGDFYKCFQVFADPLPVADESEKYMLLNGSLKKRYSTAFSPTATKPAVSIYQLQELLTKTMAENEKKTEQRILQRMESRLASMQSRIISRVQGEQKADSSSSVKGQSNAHQSMQQSRSSFMDSGTTTSISDPNNRYPNRDLKKDTKITSLDHETEDNDENYTITPDIYVCLDGGHHWYVIKNDSGTSQCPTPFLQLSQAPYDFDHSAYDVIGSTIYMVCGVYYPNTLDEHISGPTILKTREVYYMDTRSPQPEWKEASPMKNERYRPYVFVAGGKIYVVGGIKDGPNDYGDCDDVPESYVEVYDPVCDKWDYVTPMQFGHRLPTNIMRHMVISDDGDNDKQVLLVGNSLCSTQNLYLYDIDSGSCQVIKKNNDRYSWFASVIADGILYSLEECSWKYDLFAYDLDDLKRAPKLVTGLEKYLPSNYCYPIHMVSLGTGKLAVIWPVKSHTNKYNNKVIISCSKIQILKGINANGELAFEGHLLSCSTDSIQGQNIENCLTVKTPSIVNLDDRTCEKAKSTGGLVFDEERDAEKIGIETEKTEPSNQSNKYDDPLQVRDDNELNMHQLQEMILKTMSDYEQRTEHRTLQHIEACIESVESCILTKYLAGATTSANAANLG